MPQHKKHHYVPKCYLRPFSLSSNKKSINLHNIAAGRAITNAPIKGQCARAYFYGDANDLGLEKALQHIEGAYAGCIRKLQEEENSIDHSDMFTLREFAFLQWLRTDIAIKRMGMLHREFINVVYERRPEERPEIDLDDRRLIFFAMQRYINLRYYIMDLKSAIIQNKTEYDFVTSDDPCFFTNRFYIQKVRQPLRFGLASSGALFFLPLTPRHLLMCYDGKVYTVPKETSHSATTNRSADVKALNELQYLMAAENLYFSDWNDRERIRSEFHDVEGHRPKSWHEIDVFVPDEDTETWTRYRRAREEERLTATTTLQLASSKYAEPLRWISKLHYRASPKVYSDGSAMGYVKKPEWLRRASRRSAGY